MGCVALRCASRSRTCDSLRAGPALEVEPRAQEPFVVRGRSRRGDSSTWYSLAARVCSRPCRSMVSHFDARAATSRRRTRRRSSRARRPSCRGCPRRTRPGPRPHLMHCLAMRAHGTPASHVDVGFAQALETIERAVRGDHHAVDTAVAHEQVAAEADPVDRHVRRAASRRNAPSSLRSRGLKNTSAGPPTCHDVCRLMGSLRRTRRHEFGSDCHGHCDLRRWRWRGELRRAARARRR